MDEQRTRTERALRSVRKILDAMEARMDNDPKASVADYIRLLQLERELSAEQVREVRVTWQDTKPV